MSSIYLSLAKITLRTEFSPWFIPLCLLIGCIYAAILYRKESPWSTRVNWALASARFIAVSFLAFLIIGPLLNQIQFENEPPIVVLAIDDSQSVQASQDSSRLPTIITNLSQELTSNGIDVRLRGIEDYYERISSLSFNKQSTDLNSILKSVSRDFEEQNLASTILISDGIHNFGTSPQFFTSTKPIFTLGLGDTIPSQDLSIKRVNANQVVYQGKRFPMIVDVYNNGYVEEDLNVEIYSGGNRIAFQKLQATADQQINSLEFILDAEEVGIRSYQVRLVPKNGESTLANNERRTFIEVIDSEQKILIAAASPHPDIKTLKNIIEAKEGTEVSLWLQTFGKDVPEGPFDLVILHQLPGFNALPPQIDRWIEESNSFFITGTEDLRRINDRNPVLDYSNLGQTDEVSANYARAFDLFTIDDALLNRMADYPPITVPYGTFNFKGNAAVMLYQRIGSAQTNRPLLTVMNDGDKRSAVFSGTGLWKWQLQESALYNSPDLFNELFGKLIQFLATTDNKSNFEVNPIEENFTDTEPIEFITAVYNELYEPVFDYNISLKIRNENNETVEYNYVNTPTNPFSITDLGPGLYTYEASVVLNNQQELSRGSFTVSQLALEDIDLTANHQLLRNIAKNSGGAFYTIDQIDQLQNAIKALNPRPISRSSEALNPLINNPIWLIILVGLLAFEWFTRKYHGHY